MKTFAEVRRARRPSARHNYRSVRAGGSGELERERVARVLHGREPHRAPRDDEQLGEHPRRTAAAGLTAAPRGIQRQAAGPGCCARAQAAGLDGGDYGGIICCNGVKHNCVWQSNINANVSNATARRIVAACVRRHEATHLSDVDCTGAALERPPFKAGKNPNREECAAYRVESRCYRNRIGGCGKNRACRRQVRSEWRFARQQIRALC